MLRRVYHSAQAPPVGLNRVFYDNPEVDRLIEAAAVAVGDDQRKTLYAQAQRLIAEDVPYISLWYKTNVAVAQPDLRGIRLSPIADFTFLQHVWRQPAGQAHEE
jgi:peptide/nickel transport system substrate-binding protein